jgi:hypothetical protein
MPSSTHNSASWPPTDVNVIASMVGVVGPKNAPEDPCPTVVNEFWASYETPMLRHLRKRFAGFPRIKSQLNDILADFTREKILKDGYLLKMWTPARGRFRHYLGSSLIKYVWAWWKRQPEYQEWEDGLKTPWKSYKFFAVISEAPDGYCVMVVNRRGNEERTFHFPSSSRGWRQFDKQMECFAICPIAVANDCSAPQQLLKREHAVYLADGDSSKNPGLIGLAKKFQEGGYEWWQLREQAEATHNICPENGADEVPEADVCRAILAMALERAERDCKEQRPQPRGAQMWEVFRLKILDATLNDAKPLSSQRIAEMLNVRAFQVDNMNFDAREVFREHFNQVISEFENSGKASPTELRSLRGFGT